MKYLKHQIEVFESLNYKLEHGFSVDKLLALFKSQFTNLEGNLEELFFNPFNDQIKVDYSSFSNLYYYLGKRIENYDFVTNNCTWWDLEFFDNDGVTEYIDFMKRMGVISRGKLVFKNINCYKVQNGLDDRAIIEFEVNGIKKVWTILYGYTDIFIQRFANLCEELGTKGKYTIYDDGGQSFVLDYGTNEDIEKFKEATGLQRRFLKDTNHFNRPED